MGVKSAKSSLSPNSTNVYGGRMFPPVKRAAQMSDREFAFRTAAQNVLWMPPTGVMTSSVQRPATCPQDEPQIGLSGVQTWVKKEGLGRRWSVLEKIFESSVSITALVAALWHKKFGASVPIPDTVLLVVHTRRVGKKLFVGHLSVAEPSSESRNAIPKHNGTIELERVSGEFRPTQNSTGNGVRSLIQSWMGAVTEQAVDGPGLRRFVTTAYGILPWDDFGDLIEARAADLIQTLNGYQGAVSSDVELLPEEAVLTAIWNNGRANAPRLMRPEDAKKLPSQYSQMWMRRIGLVKYWLDHTVGARAIGLVFRWASGMGFPVTDLVERRFVASVWAGRFTDGESKDLEEAGKVTWHGLSNYLEVNAKLLGERFEWMRQVTQGPDSEILPQPERRYAIRVQRVKSEKGFQLAHLSFPLHSTIKCNTRL